MSPWTIARGHDEPTNLFSPGRCASGADIQLSGLRLGERTEDGCSGGAVHVGGVLELSASGQAGALVVAKSVLGGLHHEYSVAAAPACA